MRKEITEEQITELMRAIPRAEEVDRLRVEIEGLRAQLEERYIAMRVRQLEEALDAERQTARRQRAENERLRAALEGIRIDGPDAHGMVWITLQHPAIAERSYAMVGNMDRMVAIVALQFEEIRRKALEGKP